jgi:hypothetical protein
MTPSAAIFLNFFKLFSEYAHWTGPIGMNFYMLFATAVIFFVADETLPDPHCVPLR